ncbi:HEAT repeat domain-containing protein [uncultured Roseobacter sp.]|uniref:HEAT repeat domain-containing protein n=1 Tax=uncultured Roseobacter sp. TaxID=114847 RepID=UPI0026213FB6|nr:HEAT repeat domain-containing protein [uncultured Roseobacter sp.]
MAEISDRTERLLVTDCGRAISELAQGMTREDLAHLAEVIADPQETPERVGRASMILGRSGYKPALEPILASLKRLSGKPRLQAAEALGRLGGAKARDALAQLARDEDAQVRKFATLGLAQIADKKTQTLLQSIAERDSEAFIREIAGRHLAPDR